MCIRFLLVLVAVGVVLTERSVHAQDYLRLRNGQLIECAILKQDTSSVFITTWNHRLDRQPPLQVFTREEVESITFIKPTSENARGLRLYRPHANGVEVGGGLAFQTWAESNLQRRHLMQVNLHGGYSVVRQLGIEFDGGVTIPFGGAADSVWQSREIGYQAAMNLIGTPVVWRGIVPFVLFGGGAALGVPVDNVVITSSTDVRSLVNVGVGFKTGANGIGIRMEWRHHFYTWTPDAVTETGVRVSEHSADASVVRATLFIYK